jgi:hypothetical protein
LTVQDNEKIESTKSLLFLGTLTLAIWVALGTLSIWLTNQLFGWLFLGFSAFAILVVIRRLLCNSCYYCKSCTKGFTKLSKLTLGSNRIPGISKGSTLGMATTMYAILTIIPIALLVNSLLDSFNPLKLLLLAAILLITAYTLLVRAKVKGPIN